MSDQQTYLLHTSVNLTAVKFRFPKQRLLKKQPQADMACVRCFYVKAKSASRSSISIIIMSVCLAQQVRGNFIDTAVFHQKWKRHHFTAANKIQLLLH